MRCPKVLILDGHSTAAAATVLALPRTCELHVAAMTRDCPCLASRRIAKRFIQPRTIAALRSWLEELDRTEQYGLVIPSTETSLLAVKAQNLDPGLRARAVLPSESSLDTALDKQRTLALAEKLGIRLPRGRLILSLDNAPPCDAWPTVIKPVHSKVAVHDHVLSLSVCICADAAERNEALANVLPWSPVIEQEYFPGRGWGIETLFDHGKPCWFFAHERLHELPITGGASSYRRSADVPEVLYRATIDLLGPLDWHGVAMVEFKVADDGDYRLMEINPRLWGSLPLAIAAGVNFPLGLLRLAAGEPPGEQPRYRRNHYARDVVKDAHWFEDSSRGRHNPLRLTPLRPSDFIALLRPLTGRESWDLFRWNEPEVWWRTLRPAVKGLFARLQRAATVARARMNWLRLRPRWRDGAIRHVLVLCRGNTFRSPVVAAMLQRTVSEIETSSAGIHPVEGRAVPEAWLGAIERTIGLDLGRYHARAVSAHDLLRADLVLLMDALDWRALSAAHPEAMGKAVLLGIAGAGDQPAPVEIHDPYDDQTALHAVVVQLRQCTELLIRQRNRSAPGRACAGGTDSSDVPHA